MITKEDVIAFLYERAWIQEGRPLYWSGCVARSPRNNALIAACVYPVCCKNDTINISVDMPISDESEALNISFWKTVVVEMKNKAEVLRKELEEKK